MCDCKSQSFFVKNNWNSQKPIHLIRKNTTFLLNKRTSTKDTHSRRAHRTKARLEMTNWSKEKEQPIYWNRRPHARHPKRLSPNCTWHLHWMWTWCSPWRKLDGHYLLYAIPDSTDMLKYESPFSIKKRGRTTRTMTRNKILYNPHLRLHLKNGRRDHVEKK